MAKLSQINDAPSRLFGSVCLNSGALAIGATASALTTTAAIGYAINGLLYSKAAFTNQALVSGGEAFRVQPEQVTVYYVVALNAAGDVRVFQGRHLDEAYTDVSGLSVRGDGAVPDIPVGWAPMAVLKVATAAATFTPGTTALNAAGVTTTILPVMCLPAAERP